MDLHNLTHRLTGWQPARVLEHEGGDRIVDRFRLDPLMSRLWVERTVIRDHRSRDLTFIVRLFGYPEIRDWLQAAGSATCRATARTASPSTPATSA